MSPEKNGAAPCDWHGLVLPASVCQQLRQVEAAMQAATRDQTAPSINVLLWGGPGVGKTAIRRAFRDHVGLHHVAVGSADVRAQFIGQPGHRVAALFEQARAHGPSILSFDEFEYLFPSRESGRSDSYSGEAVMALLTELDAVRRHSRPVFVLAETFEPDKVDAAILKRGFITIEIPPPDETARAEMLRRAIGSCPVAPDLDVEDAARSLAGMLPAATGRDIEIIVREASARVAEEALGHGQSPESVGLTRDALLADLPRRRSIQASQPAPPGGDGVIPPDRARRVQLESLNLPEETRRKVGHTCEALIHREAFATHGIAVPPAMVIHGQGPGLAEIGRAIACHCDLPLFEVAGSDLLAQERANRGFLRGLLERARREAPAALLVTDLERVAPARSHRLPEPATDNIVRELLVHTDDSSKAYVLLIGTSAHLDVLDLAVVSHTGWQIEVPLAQEAAGGPGELANS